MATPEEYIALICPSMVTVSGYGLLVDLATSVTSSGYFGSLYDYAIALRASHMFIMNRKRFGGGGQVTQQVEGRMSVSFGGMSNLSAELQMTSYGLELLGLIKSLRFAGTISDTAVFDSYMGA